MQPDLMPPNSIISTPQAAPGEGQCCAGTEKSFLSSSHLQPLAD